jgi:DNA/RNA-binding domain of Phe-tRNA-synthetase-like protein
VKLGAVEADGVTITSSSASLVRLLDETSERIRQQFTVETLSEEENTRAVRGMFRTWGMDPSKYRPSSEALRRRVVQGKGLYRVSNVVDIGNLGSIETGWPYGCYDRGRLNPPIAFRHGASAERYEGIGKQTWQLEGRPVLADARGPFGSPISDSTRSMITEAAREILIIVYTPATATDSSLEIAMARLAERLVQSAGAEAARQAIFR